MQRWKIGKISIFSSLDVIFDFLMSWVENLNQVLTWDWYQIESECWNRVFKSSQKIDIEYSSWVKRLILKLDLTINLFNYQLSYLLVHLLISLLASKHASCNAFKYSSTHFMIYLDWSHQVELKFFWKSVELS